MSQQTRVFVCRMLYTWQCKNCQSTFVTPIPHRPRDPRPRCVTCYTGMWFLFSEPITTEAHKALARRGPTYNPYTSQAGVSK